MAQKILIITGLTCSGKSNLAMEIAKAYRGEIISADSVQVYKGLDIGSAKESKENRTIIKHHLIDIKHFFDNYNVGEFLFDCKTALDKILSKHKLPIIVGGTGLYIKALMQGYSLGGTSKDAEFRKKYIQLAKEKGNKFVWQHLYDINPEKAEAVHYNNLKRVIRYLEIEEHGCSANKVNILDDYELLAVGIVADRDEIYNKINARVDKMIDAGLEQEVRHLIDDGATKDMQAFNSIGYKEWFDYFDGIQDKDKTIELIKQHSRNYCKRQLTFLKTIPDLILCDIDTARIKIKEYLNDQN